MIAYVSIQMRLNEHEHLGPKHYVEASSGKHVLSTRSVPSSCPSSTRPVNDVLKDFVRPATKIGRQVVCNLYAVDALMNSPPIWLTRLKVAELHKLAILLGTPCSGTKAVLTQGLQNALSSLPKFGSGHILRKNEVSDRLSLVSIDMGIRNLAYSHWTATLELSGTGKLTQYTRPTLESWRKIDISTANRLTTNAISSRNTKKAHDNIGVDVLHLAEKESFEPIDYAAHAYNFIKSIIDEHEPSHILVERQRFRSGGQAAVQEWTIRVGVFEGMLYAVLKSLVAEGAYKNDLIVEPVLPTRVNRYWLEGWPHTTAAPGSVPAIKRAAREIKIMKIEFVRTLLMAANQRSPSSLFTVDKIVADVVSTFIEKKPKLSTKLTVGKQRTPEISKLDDLSDCLLQGLGWIHWQNNRLRVDALKEDAYP